LDIPVTVAQRMKSKFICDFGGVHSVRQIL
jgi:hypothetical protein